MQLERQSLSFGTFLLRAQSGKKTTGRTNVVKETLMKMVLDAKLAAGLTPREISNTENQKHNLQPAEYALCGIGFQSRGVVESKTSPMLVSWEQAQRFQKT